MRTLFGPQLLLADLIWSAPDPLRTLFGPQPPLADLIWSVPGLLRTLFGVSWDSLMHIFNIEAANALQLMTSAFVEAQQALWSADAHNHRQPLPLEPLDSWRSYLKELKNIREHIYHPTAVASGQRGLPHKVAAEIHQWHFDVPRLGCLNEYADSFQCHTSDMGIEFSSTDFEVGNVEDLLPPWLEREEELHSDITDNPRNIAAPTRGGHLMNNAVPIYGLQHASSNINCDVHTSLSYWDSFWTQLKNIEALLLMGERRRRFLWTCVRGTPRENQSHSLKYWSCDLYENRWRYVLVFLKRLRPVLSLLRLFSADKYISNVDADGAACKDGGDDADNEGAHKKGAFDPVAFSLTVHDPFFNRYVEFAYAVEAVPTEHIASWGEGCHCHEPLYRSCLFSKSDKPMSEYRRRKLLQSHFGKGYKTCPKLHPPNLVPHMSLL